MEERQRELDNPIRAGDCWRWQQQPQQRAQQLEAEAERWAAEAEEAVGSVGEAVPCFSEMRELQQLSHVISGVVLHRRRAPDDMMDPPEMTTPEVVAAHGRQDERVAAAKL